MNDNSNPFKCHVLVLNKLYQSCNLVGIKRAFKLLCKEHAEVVVSLDGKTHSYDFYNWIKESENHNPLLDIEYNDWIRTVSLKIRVPRIIRLLSYDRFPKKNVAMNRKNIITRDKSRCQYCGRKLSPKDITIDHVVPKSRGGQDTWTNLVCSCPDCNDKKAGHTLKEVGMKLIKRPARPKKDPIFSVGLKEEKYNSWKHFL